MTPLSRLTAFMDLVLLSAHDGEVRVECNVCSNGAYLFGEGMHPRGDQWFEAFLEHAADQHPEELADLADE